MDPDSLLKPPSANPPLSRRSSTASLEGGTPSQRIQFILGEGEDGGKQTHGIFCEMEELREIGQDLVWRETARWVKFEEDVAEEGDRWSKPHVATLSLHSLFELRRGLITGSVLLDLEAQDLAMIFDVVLESLVSDQQLDRSQCDALHELLMKRHTHQHEYRKQSIQHSSSKTLFRSISRNLSKSKLDEDCANGAYTNNAYQGVRKGSRTTLDSSSIRNDSTNDLSGLKPISRTDSGVSINGTDGHKYNARFSKKIPVGAQAANIMVGATELVSTPVMAYVRLSEGRMLGNITEVAVPTRFIFILLCPKDKEKQGHEIGRAIATLMCDEIFHAIAYHAKDRDDLLTGIDEFLDQVTVLPPGEWDPKIKIEPPKLVPSQEGRKASAVDLSMSNADEKKALEEVAEESHGDPTLRRTGRLFGGLIEDVKRKLPHYVSDFRDGLHVQCLASTIFMYFACLAPIVTFGGLLGSATDNYMGAMESLVSGMLCGISYHMFAGQPLTIIGSTGPVLVFETISFNFCKSQDLDYLTFRFWIGIWVFVILMVLVAFDLSALVRYITRFTEEAFAALIALIFIVEAFKKLFHILDERPVNMDISAPLDYNCTCYGNAIHAENGTYVSYNDSWVVEIEMYDESHYATFGERCKKEHYGHSVGSGCDTTIYYPDVFFFSFIVFFATFIIAYSLKLFRNASFFPNRVRVLVSDFAVIIAIIIMLGIDVGCGFHTPKLLVPETFKPTRDGRTWLVNPIGNPIWTVFAAIGFALLATILIFMDQQITAVIINRKEHKLRKGSGYHLDLTLIAIQIALCSFFGTPWFVAATVLSINHVRSLTIESECSAPGEKPKFLGVREQRLTGVVAFTLVGVSVLMGKGLKYIPMPVLYGVFLYMGVASLNGLQLVQRIVIVFMPAKYQPDYPFLEHVPLRRVHFFTVIQVLCLAVLWVIKSINEISIIFPLMVLALCFIRKLLDWVFTPHEMKWLDDVMPISHRQKKKKKKQQMKDIAEDKDFDRKASMSFEGIVNIPINQNAVMAVPVGRIIYKPDKNGTSRERKTSDSSDIELTGGKVQIPLTDGRAINVPVDRLTYNPDCNELNISEEMAKTTIWKQLIANEMDSSLHVHSDIKQDKKPPEIRIELEGDSTFL